MAYIKVELPQQRVRRIYYSPGLEDLKLAPGATWPLKWFDNEDDFRSDDKKGSPVVSLPERGEYKVTILFQEPLGTLCLQCNGAGAEGLEYKEGKKSRWGRAGYSVMPLSRSASLDVDFCLENTLASSVTFSCKLVVLVYELVT